MELFFADACSSLFGRSVFVKTKNNKSDDIDKEKVKENEFLHYFFKLQTIIATPASKKGILSACPVVIIKKLVS